MSSDRLSEMTLRLMALQRLERDAHEARLDRGVKILVETQRHLKSMDVWHTEKLWDTLMRDRIAACVLLPPLAKKVGINPLLDMGRVLYSDVRTDYAKYRDVAGEWAWLLTRVPDNIPDKYWDQRFWTHDRLCLSDYFLVRHGIELKEIVGSGTLAYDIPLSEMDDLVESYLRRGVLPTSLDYVEKEHQLLRVRVRAVDSPYTIGDHIRPEVIEMLSEMIDCLKNKKHHDRLIVAPLELDLLKEITGSLIERPRIIEDNSSVSSGYVTFSATSEVYF